MIRELYKTTPFTRLDCATGGYAFNKVIQFLAFSTNDKACKMLSVKELPFNSIKSDGKVGNYDSHKIAEATKY